MDGTEFRDLPKGTRILAAMSGGVDSTVAAYRLVQAGFDVIGITMHLVSDEYRPVTGAQASDDRACCSLNASEDARRMANVLGIPHYMLNLTDQFEEKVMVPSRMEYARGRTPNPCILCNRFMKFDILFKRAEQLGCTHVATGHYARITLDSSGFHLLRGVDPEKDQSYFLAYLTENDLSRTIFPLGAENKHSIREEASKLGLKVADRPDSQDLCFLASGPAGLSADLAGIESVSGEIVTVEGTVIGQHKGISGYTVGQRKGIPGGMPEKMYVVAVDSEKNRVVVGTDEDCYASEFVCEDISVVSSCRDIARLDSSVGVQIRYRTKPVPGRVIPGNNLTASVIMDEPVRAITPGQISAFYDDDEVIGAGVIVSVNNPHVKT